MRRCPSYLVCFAIAAALAVPATARAATVFTNLSGSAASNLPVGFTGADWTYGAQQFNSGNNTLITDVTLSLLRVASSANTYSVELWSDSANSPGSLVGAIATGQLPSSVPSPGPTNVTYSGNVSVSPNTPYWVVMNMSGTASQLLWQYTDDSPSSAGFVGVVGTGLLRSSDAPTGFSTPGGITDGRLMMSVVGVPEPSTMGLLAAAGVVGGIAVVRRRRR